jgi:hypothetical protein
VSRDASIGGLGLAAGALARSRVPAEHDTRRNSWPLA